MASFISYCVELFIILALLIAKYFRKKDEKGLPGPDVAPIIGNALAFWCKDEDVFQKIADCIRRRPSPMRFWNGSKLYVIFKDPSQVEKIFSSTTFAAKDDIYGFMKDLCGEGLMSNSGSKWKKDRRLMTPLFLKRNVTQYFPTILKHSKILNSTLETKFDTFDIGVYINKTCTDFINESFIGALNRNVQGGRLDECFTKLNELIFRRMIKPWLQIDVLYMFTNSCKEEKAVKRKVHDFFIRVLHKAKENHSHLGQKDDIIRSILEQMLDIRDEVPDFATDEEIVHHLATLYLTSLGIISNVCALSLVLLGMYPNYQQKVADEVFKVVGRENDIREEHLSRLDYLERVIKEVLRLFPFGPFIARQANQDIEIDSYHLAQGTSVVIPIYNIHRDPNHWEKPNDFYPDHFLPQAVKKRHPYAYVPFSAGMRSCIGKPYSYMTMKILIVSVLQKFRIEVDDEHLSDISLTGDFMVKFKEKPYLVRLKRN